jgi:CheY-like chemotaxis protein
MAAPEAPAPAADTTPTDFDTPDWLKSMAAPEASAPVVAPTPTDFDAPDWLKNSSETPTPPAPEPVSPQPTLSNDFDVDLPSWLKGAKVEADEPVEASMPSWLETSTLAADVPASAPASASAFTDFPDEISATETPDWLSNLGLKPVAPEQSKSFNTETSIPPLVPEETDAAFTEEPFPSGDLDTLFTDMPDWLTGITASAPAAAEPPSAEDDSPPARPERSWSGGGRILLVEDEDMVRAVAERALTRAGYTVTTASDGEQGLERVAEGTPFDLVVSDVVMPSMDGPAMARELRKTHPTLPVLFMSGYAEEQLRNEIDIEEMHFIAKPFSVQEIGDKVAEVLRIATQ